MGKAMYGQALRSASAALQGLATLCALLHCVTTHTYMAIATQTASNLLSHHSTPTTELLSLR